MSDYKNLRFKEVDYGFGWHEYDNPSTDGIVNILERLDEKYGKLEQENAKLKERLKDAESVIEFYDINYGDDYDKISEYCQKYKVVINEN